jgi:hypothetical protein
MNKQNESIIINKPFVAAPQLNVHLSKNQAKAIKWMTKRFVEDGLLTNLEDLQQFVRSRTPQGSKATTRKFAQRLVDLGKIKRVKDGIFVPAGYTSLIKDTDIKTLSKIKSKRERTSIIKTRKEFLNQIQPIIADKQNKWSLPLTHVTVKFKINKLYEKVNELKLLEKRGKYYLLPFQCQDFPYLKAAFHIYRNKVILKLGNPDYPIHASENVILTVISICHKYLISTNEFWRFNLEIPSSHEWIINIPSIYTITINQNYSKFGKSIKDDTLGYELTDKGNCLLLKRKLSLTQLKPAQLIGLFNKYYPLDIPNLAPFKLTQNLSINVTLSNEHENSNFTKTRTKCHTFENFLENPNFN